MLVLTSKVAWLSTCRDPRARRGTCLAYRSNETWRPPRALLLSFLIRREDSDLSAVGPWLAKRHQPRRKWPACPSAAGFPSHREDDRRNSKRSGRGCASFQAVVRKGVGVGMSAAPSVVIIYFFFYYSAYGILRSHFNF